MTENIVIKGGSQLLHNAQVLDHATLELHAIAQDNSVVQDKAIVARSIIKDSAVISGTARVKDAVIGGTTVLNVEYVGKNGHVFDNTHVTYVKLNGEGYTIHRTQSEAKGFSAQIMREDGVKITVNMLKDLIEQDNSNRILQYLFNARKKDYTDM